MASLRKALALLDVIAAAPEGLAAREISDTLRLPMATTYRLLAVLVDADYVIHLPRKSRFALGYELHHLGASLHRQVDPPISVTRLITRLHIEADAAAYFAVHRGEDIVLAHVVDSKERPRIASMGFGFSGAGHATAFGKILLAGMSRPELDHYLARHGMAAMTTATICDADVLDRQLADVRDRGMAVEQEEFTPGVCCLAVPIPDAAGHAIGSVAVSVDAPEFSARRPALDRVLRSIGHEVGHALKAQARAERVAAGTVQGHDDGRASRKRGEPR